MITDFKLLSKFKPFYKAGKSLCVTDDGFIIADDGENINYINRENLQLIKTFNKEEETVTCFVANPSDYTVIIANKDLQLRRIDRLNSEKRGKIWNSCHSSPIFIMSLNKSSTRLATGGSDNKVRIWHIGDNEGFAFSCIFHKSKITILKNNPARPMVVSASMVDFEIAAWDTDNGKQLGIFSGHLNAISCIDFHEDGNTMISVSYDQTLMVWNCKSFEKLSIIPICESVETCIVWKDCINDNLKVMIGGERGIMSIISVSKKTIIQEFKKSSIFITDEREHIGGGLRSIRTILPISERGIVVVRESDNIEFYNDSMLLQYELAGQISSLIDVMVVGENKNMLLAIESAPYMRLFDCGKLIKEGSECTQWPSQLVAGGHTSEITTASVFDNGCQIVSGGKDGRICIWKLNDDGSRLKMKLVTSFLVKEDIVSSVCSDKSGNIIYVNYSKTDNLCVFSYNAEILTKICDISKPHAKIVTCMDVSSDNSLLATGSKDKLAKIWSYSNKKKQLANKGILKGHKRGILSVKFSTLEKLLLTSSIDKTIRLWSLDNLDCVLELQSDFVIYKALFSQNEKQIVSCDENGLVCVWNCEKKSVSYTLNVHDQSTYALNLTFDHDGNVSGFVVAGDSSMMSFYKDVSKVQIEESKKMNEKQLEQQQELDNLLIQEHFISAFRLAIKLNKPMSAFVILEKIRQSEVEEPKEMTPIEMSMSTKISEAFKTLDNDELKTLFQFSIKWMTNNKTFQMAASVFTFMFCVVPNKDLMTEDFLKHFQSMKSHAYKHYLRTKAAIDTVGLLETVSFLTSRDQLQKMDTD